MITTSAQDAAWEAYMEAQEAYAEAWEAWEAYADRASLDAVDAAWDESERARYAWMELHR